MAPSTPAGEVTVRFPSWAIGVARAGSIVAMFFGLVSLMLMISGAPKYPVYWPSVWQAVGLTLFALGVFIVTTAPSMAGQSAVGVAHSVAGALPAASTAARADNDETSGDEEIYASAAPVVDPAKRVSMTPGNDLADGAPTTQRRAMAASAMDRRANDEAIANGNGVNSVNGNGVNRNTANSMGRRPATPRR